MESLYVQYGKDLPPLELFRVEIFNEILISGSWKIMSWQDFWTISPNIKKTMPNYMFKVIFT